MTHSTQESLARATAFAKRVPVLFFLVRQGGAYKVGRRWGIFDSLGVRAIDDLTFAESSQEKTIVAFTEEPPHTAEDTIIAIPAQIAFERIFFHIQGISTVVINPRGRVEGGASQQQGVELSIPSKFAPEERISRVSLPELIGAYALPKKKVSDLLARAERALQKGSLFEAFYLARSARLVSQETVHRAWFIELFALSFLGLPEEALALYEEYPGQGSSEPEAQLLAARFRLLLKQFNEARTILHTLTFHERLGAIAACELARSYVVSGEFDRAIDIASGAIQKDSSYYEAYLVRGIAQRGLSYPAGDEEGLKEALKDFEKVAHNAGFSAPEALFHAGTVFGRLGALEQAEVALRQSLFQRDRFSSRDALVRVLCASQKVLVARDELELLSALAPSATEELRREVATHVAAGEPSGATDLWATERESAITSASRALSEWKVPVSGSLQDFALLDDLINRFAPAGDFMETGEFGHLHEVGEAAFGRAVSLYLGARLIGANLATWEGEKGESISLISSRGARIPLETFVQERLVLGSSGDNFTSLESIVADICGVDGGAISEAGIRPEWWQDATAEEVRGFKEQAEWARAKLKELGAELQGSLRDLEEIDRVIEHTFEPGGVLKEVGESVIGDDVDRFVVGLGLIVGSLISEATQSAWSTHELPEGLSLLTPDLGRIFPIARLQRRVYLSSAAGTAGKLESLAFVLAAAVISQRIRAGVYTDRPHIVTAFKEILPRVAEFSESELDGVVDTLLARYR